MTIEYIDTPQQLADFADRHGLRPDWHEPDEQNIDARIVGGHLDNANGARGRDRFHTEYEVPGLYSELRVVLVADDDPDTVLASVNVASVLAWASMPYRGETQ